MAKKGQKFKTWTADEKYNVIKPIIDLEISLAQVGKNTGVSNSMLHRWIKSYKENGYDGLKAKKKPGNPLMKYSRRKILTKEEHLEYENMKLRIENELLKKGYLMKGDGKIHEVAQIKYEIIELLSKEFNIKSLCLIMKVSRSGYYKWLKNKENLNNYELNRKDLGILIKDIHTRKPSYGYHRINAIIRRETGWIVSDNLVHKVCKLLNIKSKTRHYKYKKTGEESIKYSNQICGNWNTTRPFEKIVSDTTTFWFRKRKYDWTFYLDVFNNEIVGYDVRDSMHGNGIINHREALNDMLNNKIKRGYKELETIVHTDQGSVYSSVSFNNIFKSYMVSRSMSRAGTPTDNPVIESKNGWIKKEMYIDFDINNYNTVQEFIDDIVWDNNNFRPSYALNYKTPIDYKTQLGFK